MSRASRFAEFLYRRMLLAYPAGFRAEFEVDTGLDFLDAARHAQTYGTQAFLVFCFREVRDWPLAVLIAYWRMLNPQRHLTRDGNWQLRIGRDDMSNQPGNRSLLLPTEWERFIAALPLLLFGMGIFLASFASGAPWLILPRWRFILALVLGLFPMAAIGLIALRAIYKGSPDWSWTWIGSAYMGVSLFLKTAAEEQADVGKYVLSAAGDIMLVAAILLTGAVLISMVAFKSWQQAGLFSMGAAGTLVLSLFMYTTVPPFNRFDLALFSAPGGLLLAAIVFGYVRGNNFQRLAALVVFGLLNGGLTLRASRVWIGWQAAENQVSPLLPLLAIGVLTLISGPLWAVLTKPVIKRLRSA